MPFALWLAIGNESTRGLTYNIRNVTTSITPPGGAAGALGYLGTDSDELIADAGATLHNNCLAPGCSVQSDC